MATNNDQEKKLLIKQSARELFFRFGFSKTSMDDIARQCGLAKPTLYYYFSNKEAIFNEVVIEEAEGFMDSVEKKLPRNLPADRRIALFYRTVYRDLKAYAANMVDMPPALYEHSPHGRPIVDKINQMLAGKLRPMLESGKREGIFQLKDEEATVSALVFMSDFLNLDWMHRYPEKMRDRVVEHMIQIILNGLKRRT